MRKHETKTPSAAKPPKREKKTTKEEVDD
jgi:hypothetical protein